MAKISAPSEAVLAARARRAGGVQARLDRIEWYIKEVSDKIEMTMEQRVKLATHFVKDKVVRNISRPVTKVKTSGGKTRATDRSKPGEFPKADTTMLMKTIFEDYRNERNGPTGYIGTPLDYGAILETSVRLNRSFLLRTLREEGPTITRILTGPIK